MHGCRWTQAASLRPEFVTKYQREVSSAAGRVNAGLCLASTRSTNARRRHNLDFDLDSTHIGDALGHVRHVDSC